MEPNQPKVLTTKQFQQHAKEEKTYILQKKSWKDFKLHKDIIEALYEDDKMTPRRVQSLTLEVTLNPNHKKINILIRAAFCSGKTMSFLILILNSLQPGLKIAEDKFFKGKIMKREIFIPQSVIIVQNDMLQDQIYRILQSYEQFGAARHSEKLKFKIGRLDTQMHEPGDILVAMPKSFLNRYQRGNLKLDNCKFIAIDQIDEIFVQQKQTLAEILKIADSNRPSIISCTVFMKKQLIQFYDEHSKDVIKININQMIQKELGGQILFQRVQHYYRFSDSKEEMHKYIINTLFKHFYGKIKDSSRPQMIIYFDSIDEIKDFQQYFKARASDFTSDQSEYLKPLTIGIISTKKYEDGKKVEMTIKEKRQIMAKFRNNQVNILCATNIIARGIDIRNSRLILNVGPPKYSQKEADINLDIYLQRARTLGLDPGLVLTLAQKNDLTRLVQGIKKIHKIYIHQMKNPIFIRERVLEYINYSSQSQSLSGAH